MRSIPCSAPLEQSGIDLGAQTREEVLRTIAAIPPAADCSPQHAVRSLACADVPVLMYVD